MKVLSLFKTSDGRPMPMPIRLVLEPHETIEQSLRKVNSFRAPGNEIQTIYWDKECRKPFSSKETLEKEFTVLYYKS